MCDFLMMRLRSKCDNIKEIERTVQTSKYENALLKEMKTVTTKLKEDLLDLKGRNIRDNLIVTNIPEQQQEYTEQVLVGLYQNIAKELLNHLNVYAVTMNINAPQCVCCYYEHKCTPMCMLLL